MKSYVQPKVKGVCRVNPQKVIFELKHRVALALNKLADRDTYQIGAEELEKIAEGLTPDGIIPFLSCIIETDSEQKSAVRKECIRMMGLLARFHEDLLAPHIGKMVGSIVKRLKDPDSVVRDACVETMGILASAISNCGEGGGPFVVLAKPLFEALGEQNKQVQHGSALCLARVIDNGTDPPIAVLARMLTRIIKLLSSQHFMAKPALIELVRSIIQAGGASTEHSYSAALTSIQDALKSSDWTTRKAASVALAAIAVSGGSLLSSFKGSCIRSLESCRFDRVKPVRDSIMQAIQYWKNLGGSDYPEPSEAGSSTKENLCGDQYLDLTSARVGVRKDNCEAKNGSHFAGNGTLTCSTKERSPLAIRKACTNYVQNHHLSKTNDWPIEIALPKTRSLYLADTQNEESEGSCVTKTSKVENTDTGRAHKTGPDYMPVIDKPESSTMSDICQSGSFEIKHATISHSCLEGDSFKEIKMDDLFPAEIDHEGNISSLRAQERKSLESTVTGLSSQRLQGCCAQTAGELAAINKQLLEIKSKQENLMDLLQVFMGSSMDSLCMLQSKVLDLEHVIDKIAVNHNQGMNHAVAAKPKFLKSTQNVSLSPRFSTCTPRPSIEATSRQSSLFPNRGDMWDESSSVKSRSSISSKQGIELWREPTHNIIKKPIAAKAVEKQGNPPKAGPFQSRKVADPLPVLSGSHNHKLTILDRKNSLRNRIKDFLCSGDLDSAFMEAICSGDELLLVELMDSTGPVLQSLSNDIINEILSIVAGNLLDQKFLSFFFPWLHQMVDLSTSPEPNYFVLSVKAKKELLSALQEASAMDFSDPINRRSVTQIVLKLRQAWGKYI